MLVPTCVSAPQLGLLPRAVALAQQLESSIQLLGLAPSPALAHCLHRAQLLRCPDEVIVKANKLLLQLVRSTIPQEMRGGTLMRVGEPANEIRRAACSTAADLIVMSVPYRSSLRHRLFPSVAERVVRAQPCLTYTIPETLLKRQGRLHSLICKHILVPVDLTESSRLLVQWVISLAERMRARITLRYAPAMLPETFSGEPRRQNLSRTQVPKFFEHQLAQWVKPDASVRVEVDLSPEMEVANEAVVAQMVQRAASDLIVVANRSRAWWQQLAHVDGPERILRVAPCPVLNVPVRALTTSSAAAAFPGASPTI